MRFRMIRQAALFTMTLSLLSLASASNFESAEHINEVAKNFLLESYANTTAEKVEIKVNPAHAPIEVAKCSQDIMPSIPQNSSTSQIAAVELTCSGEKPWHIYIPVTVQLFNKVVVARSTILPKELIKEDDLDYALYDTNRLYNGYFKDKADVINNVTTILIPAGNVLSKKEVTAPIIVHRNQVVSLVSGSGTIMVSMQGIAKSDGGLNSMVQVYNPISKKTVDALIIGPNKAQAFG
ncbi:MAG: flagellar basal body P-ring formation chaperone FlgA [Gammaproteobacteria bacterium]